MLFSSLTFLFYFLPLCFIVYYVIPKRFIGLKNIILLIFSLLFYAWGEPKYVFLMLITVLLSYIGGILLDYLDKNSQKLLKKICFVFVITLILGSLFYFKYFDFTIININKIFNTNIGLKQIVLPIGISFYTFQILSYVIDLYRKKIPVQKNILNLALYISFFPQLIAGPIVTYEQVEEQLKKRTESLDNIAQGIERFIFGLAKKVLIANQMALLADTVYNAANIKEFSFLIIIIGTLAYTFQIYFDFSGYSDMAIGLGKVFGFTFLENFNYPYIATSISDFWKRWHISLTNFFRNYLYIPLGGSCVKKSRWILNFLIVWLLTGLWHGAKWNFIFWGLYYFVLLLLERTVFKNIIQKIPKIIKYILTFSFINLGWMLFRINELSDLLLIFNFKSTINLTDFIYNNMDVLLPILMLPIAFVLSLDLINKLCIKLRGSIIFKICKRLFRLEILLLTIAYLVSLSYNPFIYFRF